MREIKLNKNYITRVSDEDFEWLSKYTWFGHHNGFGYVSVEARVDGRKVRMPRLIMGVIDNPTVQVDHIDGDSLNNQRDNLRTCSIMENKRNSLKKPNKSSMFKGVSFYTKQGRWKATICVEGTHVFLGSYESEIAAASAYNWAAIKFFGEFARLNTLDDSVILPTTPERFLKTGELSTKT